MSRRRTRSAPSALATPAELASPELTAVARGFIENVHAPNTRRMYQTRWRQWLDYCHLYGVPPTANVTVPGPDGKPCRTTAALANFLADLAARCRGDSALTQATSAINLAYRLLKLPPPTTSSMLVAAVIKGARRSGTSRPEGKRALTARSLKAILDANEGFEPVTAARNRALVLVSMYGALRCSECLALRVGDIEWVLPTPQDPPDTPSPKAMVVHIRRSKTDQQGRGIRKVIAAMPEQGGYCPVEAMRQWMAVLQHHGIDGADAPVWYRIQRGGHLAFRRAGAKEETTEPITGSMTFARILKHMCHAAGVPEADVEQISTHSLRASFASIAAQSKVPIADIARHLGHKNLDTTMGYIRGIIDADTTPTRAVRLAAPAAATKKEQP